MRAVLLRCPYCKEGFDFEDEITRCSQCNAVHHQTCWDENHHCSVFACKGVPYRSRSLGNWIDYVPAFFLLFLALNPIFFIPLGFLWFPAALCTAAAAYRLFYKIISTVPNTAQTTVFTLALNVAGIVAILLRFGK
jgi:hypothetical protein